MLPFFPNLFKGNSFHFSIKEIKGRVINRRGWVKVVRR